MSKIDLELGYISDNLTLDGSDYRFRKEIIRAGVYHHPDAPDGVLQVTVERMQVWADNFREAGIKVWVPYRHSRNPRDNTGWVEDVFVEGDKLFAVLNITDEEAAISLKDGTIQDVSIGIEFDFTDDKGRYFGEVIRHIALTLDPHIREQDPFDMLTGDKNGDPKPTTNQTPTPPISGNSTPPEIGAEAEKKTQIMLEGNRTYLEADNMRLEQEVSRLKQYREDSERRETANLVRQYIEDGILTPGCREQAYALLSARSSYIELENSVTSVYNTFRELLDNLPPRIGYGQALTMESPEPATPPDENELLAQLGISQADISQYSDR